MSRLKFRKREGSGLGCEEFLVALPLKEIYNHAMQIITSQIHM